ncbi:WhiB family transcriptional regulator [Rhodococcus sp. UNC363MFTsu5.1]|uniref:WhiB family transcriptional regulator n=1 Tax=Rhodococcus sp. UNC363MFTsu5.1 TaxID=1449069 RepID=UPI0018CC3CF7|nr:WhiB family transcriptional regulator [Rhodococcus sp. UNC363MFTsu5.1]
MTNAMAAGARADLVQPAIRPPVGLGDNEGWRAGAKCAQSEPDEFFPDRCRPENVRAAKEVCQRCPVAAECLEYALGAAEPFGVWGGKTPRERRRMRSGRPIPGAAGD